MNRCIRCDDEHSILTERGLCPSCEYFVMAGLPEALQPFSAPVALPSGDGDAALDAIRLQNNQGRFCSGAQINLLLAEIDRLRAANAALQATVHNKEVALEAYRIERESTAPNGGETAAHLCSVIGCGKVATHVSDVVYRDGVQAHYCDEHTRHERPIEAAGTETAKPLVTKKGRVIRPGPNLVATFGPAAMLADALAKKLDRLDTTPEQPATARKLSSVKLTAAQVKALQRIDAEFLTFHNINKQTRKALVKQALIDVYWSTEFEATLLRLTDLGRAALAARESEAGK